jgi:hypothetical protein
MKVEVRDERTWQTPNNKFVEERGKIRGEEIMTNTALY